MNSFCHIKESTKYALSLKALSSKGKTWDVGSTVDIVFFNGTRKQKNTFKRACRDIVSHANLKVSFDKVSKREADIKVRFLRAGGNWSYLGTDALMTGPNEHTVSISNDDYGTCLHEACHALGAFKHEHQHPLSGFRWNKEAVIKDLSGPPNNWSLPTIHKNVLDKSSISEVLYTEFDSDGVMLYPIPNHWTYNDVKTRNNNKLSDKDKQHLRRIYPFPGNGVIKDSPFKRFIRMLRKLFGL